ncbi:hypothetical protein FOMPIDRAFT_1022803 [Fomitopsis schrenkii]|uniref:Uncharacterized protein n=1 Tax=Fomitopsis schrenkii TaxID=2126942 RepID=S8FVZ0_FOMSC|nr:hypothetical protein FOMPIDRAFT_1022803 [Fomitopsis schrenkii]
MRRTLATATEPDSLDIDYPPPLPEFDSKSSDTSSIPPHTHAVFVRPWEGISSMPELLAMVRGLERHYGRIREYGVMRDFDVNFQYLPYFWVNFEDPASFARVPETPTLLKLDVPRIDLARPGGIGLDDLQGLLQPEKYVSPEEAFDEAVPMVSAKATKKPQTVTVDIRVERAKIPFQLRGMRPHQTINRNFLGGFYGWGGFYQLPAPNAAHPSATMQMGVERRKPSMKDLRTQGRQETAEGAEEVEDVDSAERAPSPTDAVSWSNEPTIAASATEAAGPTQASDLSSVTDAATSAPTPTADAAEIPLIPEAEPATPRLSKREQILARARANARTPLPQLMLQPEEKRREEEEKEREEEDRVRTSVRERLWQMIGSKWS